MCISDKERFFRRIEESKAQGVCVNIEEDPIANFEIPTKGKSSIDNLEITETPSTKRRRRTLEN
jgi:hypothetical protein